MHTIEAERTKEWHTLLNFIGVNSVKSLSSSEFSPPSTPKNATLGSGSGYWTTVPKTQKKGFGRSPTCKPTLLLFLYSRFKLSQRRCAQGKARLRAGPREAVLLTDGSTGVAEIPVRGGDFIERDGRRYAGPVRCRSQDG
jgi:hypothetical protein